MSSLNTPRFIYLSSYQESSIIYSGGTGEDTGKSNTREDINVVTLTGNECLAAIVDAWLRWTTGKDTFTLCMCVSFLCCAFSFWGWIRQGKNDWTLNRVQNVVLVHALGETQNNFGPVHSLYFAIFSKMDFENNFPAPAKPIIAVGFNSSTHSSKLLIFLWSWANLICIGSKSNLSEVINPST